MMLLFSLGTVLLLATLMVKVRRDNPAARATFHSPFLLFLRLRRRLTKKPEGSRAVEVWPYLLVEADASQSTDVGVGAVLVLKLFAKEVSVHQSEPVALETELGAADDQRVDRVVRWDDG